MKVPNYTRRVEQLDREGFCLVPDVLGQATLDELAQLAEQKLNGENNVDLLLVPHFSSLPNECRAHYVNQFCLPPVG